MSKLADKTFDCIVIGGGPAGATAATVLVDHGRSVLLLERGKFPRHHIGESLMPQTYWTFKRIGMLDKLAASDFVRKESVQFISPSGKESLPYYFKDRDPGEWSVTWQVTRDRFDRMMLDNAQEHGVEVREGMRVQEVLFEDGQAVGVRVLEDGRAADQAVDVRCRVVIDASGQVGVIARQLDLRVFDTDLKKAAIYAYYKGAYRDDGRNAGATMIIHTPNRNGWFWSIPLENDITSVGVVAPPSHLFTGRGDEPLYTLDEEIESTPRMRERLSGATRVSQVYVTSDFSYRSKRMAGDGWVLVGDAFSFLDPVYSAGVMLALKSGEMAADAIHDGLAADDVSGERLGRFAPQLCNGMQSIRRLVYAFYDKQFSFGAFVSAHPEHEDHLVRVLIGDVFNDEVGAMFDVMRDWVKLPDPMPLEGTTI